MDKSFVKKRVKIYESWRGKWEVNIQKRKFKNKGKRGDVTWSIEFIKKLGIIRVVKV